MGSRLEQKSNLVRKRIEQHTFDNEDGDEYEGSKFGGFPEYFRRKKIKLQNLDAEKRAQSDKPKIFKNVVCHVNGYTQPSLNDLHNLIIQYGGGFCQYLDGKTMVTHIIASNLTPKKKEEFKRYRIVKPAWIVDSVAAGRLLPWDAYRVVDEGVGQKVLGFDNGKIVSQANRKAGGYREQTDNSWYTEQLASSSRRQPDGSQFEANRSVNGDEITSSMEQELLQSFEESTGDKPLPSAMDDSSSEIADRPIASNEQNGEPSVDTSISPVLAPSAKQADLSEEADSLREQENDRTSPPGSQTHAPETLNPSEDNNDQQEGAATALQPRDGSQEPDYSMAVIRNSEIFNSIPPEKLAHMTAEEHNALLLSDPAIRKSTVVHPDFLEQYYRESRLHHLSTWKADLKSQMQALAASKSSQKSKVKKLPGQRRYVMHVDFDSFFAAVSLLKYPQYMDKPTVVAHGGGNGSEIASCNYIARKFGVKNGMWMRRAQELCPHLKIIPYDFTAYEEASRKFYDAIIATGGVVQSVSIDEALVDISALCFAESATDGIKRHEGAVYREQQKADDIAQRLRDEVKKATGCAVSVGIGGNILQAKLALRDAKPAGQRQLKPEDVLDFMGGLEVQALPGVAWSIAGKLEEIGIKLIKDVRECTRERLISTLGPKTGEKIWEYARGIDKTEVGDSVVRKSVSAEVNWGVRFETNEQVDEFMAGLCGELHKRLVKENLKGQQITMKVMRRAADAPLDPPKHLGHGKCDHASKSVQLGVSTNDQNTITKEAITLMRSFNISPGELRGIGVQMQKLAMVKSTGNDPSSQKKLFFKGGPAASTTTSDQETLAQRDVADTDVGSVNMIKQMSPALKITDPMDKGSRLNIAGTQFALPTQFDPAVFAELPDDIRSRLARKSSLPDRADEQVSIDQNQAHESIELEMPSESQMDPEILDSLPEDIKREILTRSASSRRAKQTVLPGSPRKARTLPPPKSAPKRSKGSGLLKFRGLHAQHPTLTQSNFVTKSVLSDNDSGRDSPGVEVPDLEHVDEEFLAALPAELRNEVLAQQRQQRLQNTGGIDTSLHQRPRALQKRTTKVDARVIKLPSSAALPTFTSRKLSSLPELRDALNTWIDGFLSDGPIESDLDALLNYLEQVVLSEKNLNKAVAVAKWVAWLIDDRSSSLRDFGIASWKSCLKQIKQVVQKAASQRGIGELNFD